MLYALKVLISALVIVAITEVSKRGGPFWGGVLASLPLTSLLAFVWLYAETRDADKIAALSWNVFYLVIPSLSLFVALPLLLKRGLAFPMALGISITVRALCYGAFAFLMRRFGVMIRSVVRSGGTYWQFRRFYTPQGILLPLFMRPQAKWFRSATMMAFLAVVALFVSPVLALACCCSAPSASSVVAASHQDSPAMPSCHGGAAHHSKAQIAESKSPANCAQVSAVCECQSQNVDTALMASENGVFQFTPALGASEKVIFAAAFAAQERPLHFVCETARPRGPDRNLASGRAPPVLALS